MGCFGGGNLKCQGNSLYLRASDLQLVIAVVEALEVCHSLLPVGVSFRHAQALIGQHLDTDRQIQGLAPLVGEVHFN